MNYISIIKNGIIKENPTFVLMLGMCPTLATTTSAMNGMSMGLATMAVLICTNVVISCLKSVTPDKVRIPVFIVVIAAFVTILQMVIKAYLPDIDAALGLFIPLIVVNCIILGRAEGFASKQSPVASLFDGIGIGLGFTLGLTLEILAGILAVVIFALTQDLGSRMLLVDGYTPLMAALAVACGAVDFAARKERGAEIAEA